MTKPTSPKCILLVEDEPIAGNLCKEGLERLGHRVLLVNDGEEALVLFEATPKEFDIILSDYQLPGFDGRQLSEKIRMLDQQIPIIIISGFVDEKFENEFKSYGITDYLLKPVTIARILEKIELHI